MNGFGDPSPRGKLQADVDRASKSGPLTGVA
jgi:hypothetical protein